MGFFLHSAYLIRILCTQYTVRTLYTNYTHNSYRMTNLIETLHKTSCISYSYN